MSCRSSTQVASRYGCHADRVLKLQVEDTTEADFIYINNVTNWIQLKDVYLQ